MSITDESSNMMTLILHLHWIPTCAGMTRLGAVMMDLSIRKFVYVSLDTGIRQYDGYGYDELLRI